MFDWWRGLNNQQSPNDFDHALFPAIGSIRTLFLGTQQIGGGDQSFIGDAYSI
jgi:hypothetical protein